jgi:hypothetical protein
LSREGCPLCNPSSRPLPYRSPGFGMITEMSSLSDTSPWPTRYSQLLHQASPYFILRRFTTVQAWNVRGNLRGINGALLTLEYSVFRVREPPEGPKSCQQDARLSSPAGVSDRFAPDTVAQRIDPQSRGRGRVVVGAAKAAVREMSLSQATKPQVFMLEGLLSALQNPVAAGTVTLASSQCSYVPLCPPPARARTHTHTHLLLRTFSAPPEDACMHLRTYIHTYIHTHTHACKQKHPAWVCTYVDVPVRGLHVTHPPPLAQTLAMPIYPYPYWVPQSTSGLW